MEYPVRVLLSILMIASILCAVAFGLFGLIFGYAFVSHPIKGNPDAPMWRHLVSALQWGAFSAAAPALLAVIFGALRHFTPRSAE